MIEILLGIGFVGSLAAFFVAWAKLDEQKKLTQEERKRRWDEISRAVGLENEIARWKEANTDRQKDIAFYLVELGKQYAECEKMKERLSALQTELEQEKAYFEACRAGNRALQDKLSALLCPMNDHVWIDGCCVKCGRMQQT